MSGQEFRRISTEGFKIPGPFSRGRMNSRSGAGVPVQIMKINTVKEQIR